MPSIGGFLGDTIGKAIGQGFDVAMKALWAAALALLKAAFGLADRISVFDISTGDGPVGALWPMMLWVSGVVAVGLFFTQLTTAALRGGRGILRTVAGPVQYGLALGITAAAVAAFLTAADGLTRGILHYGLDAANFQDALAATGLGDAAVDSIKAVQLGLIAMFGVLPSAIGYVLEMLFRQAAILILVACVPVTAAGLLADVTAPWFWRTARWMLASIIMKPVLALALVLGVGTLGGADGIKELLIGQGILLISLLAPFALFRLFAFVDPNTEAGRVFRDTVSGAGFDSYPGVPDLPSKGDSGDSGGGEPDAGAGSIEMANAGRFDTLAAHADETYSASGTGHPEGSTAGGGTAQPAKQSDPEGGGSQPSGDSDTQTPAPPANRGSVVASSPTSGGSGGEAPPPAPGSNGPDDPPEPDGGGRPRGGGPRGGGGPKSGGGGGAAAGEAGEAAETAVIV